MGLMDTVTGILNEGSPFNKLQEEMLARDRFTGFIPDQAVWEEQMQLEVDDMLAGLPIAEEQFNAQLAARGIYGSGEAPKAMYQDVYAPVARGVAATTGKYKLGYQEMALNQKMQVEQMRQNIWSTMLQAMIQREQIQAQKDAQGGGFWGAIGDIGGIAVGTALGGPVGGLAAAGSKYTGGYHTTPVTGSFMS